MTILVTGGTGLVGSRLLRRFANAGVDCRALVRPGKEVPAGVNAVEGDLTDAATLQQAMEGVSAIVHLAAVFRTQNDEDIWRANLDGTKNLIAAARAYAPEARFVMASTGLVYDADANHPGLEEDATHPTLAYPASKIAAESELRLSGLNWSILRLGLSMEMAMDIWLRSHRWLQGSNGTRRSPSVLSISEMSQPPWSWR